MEVTITVEASALRALLRTHAQSINRATLAGMHDAQTLLLRDMKTYPGKPPGSKYDRTGKLRDSWSKTPITGAGVDITGGVGSDPIVAPYNVLVQHPEFQAAVHVGRWQTTETVINRRLPRIQENFDRRMREAFAGT